MLNQVLLDEKEEKSVKDKFINALVNASKQIDKNGTIKYVLQYVHAFTTKTGNSIVINSTDSHRAYINVLDVHYNYNFDKLISVDSIKDFEKGKTNKLETFDTSDILSANTNNCVYPNLNRVIPDSRDIVIKVKPIEILPFLTGFKTANNFKCKELGIKNSNKYVVNLSIDDLSGKKDDWGMVKSLAKISSPYTKTGFIFNVTINNKCDIAFNYKYLIDALKCFNKNEAVEIDLSKNKLRPFKVWRKNTVCVVCPVRQIN